MWTRKYLRILMVLGTTRCPLEGAIVEVVIDAVVNSRT